jgi:tetratricopeptide (TPR) repeat protein
MVAALLLAAAAQRDASGLAEFERGNEFFGAGEYDLALPYFQKAYELSGRRPSTIRALAQCERALGMYDEAIAHFQEYLETDPEEAAQIEKTLELLEEARQKKRKKEAAANPAPPPPPPPEVEEPGAPHVTDVAAAPPPAPPPPAIATEVTEAEEGSGVGWTILWIGLGVAAAVGGGVALGFALSGTEDPYGGTTDRVLGME